jgi:type II pantothenate kinase
MSHFCLLRSPETYAAHSWDLVANEAERKYWIDHFARHFEEVARHASTQYGRTGGKAIMTAKAEFAAEIEKLRANPASLPDGKLNILSLCRLRESILRKNRLNDPFKHIKTRENANASKLYPQLVRRLHVMEPEDKWLHLVECIFAGNIFDLGSSSTMHLADKPTDFLAAVENVKPRPWLVDDFDALLDDFCQGPPMKWSKAVIFLDNAGSDFILGVMPLARELALYGCKIILAANELPSLNDMTADETAETVERLGESDPDLGALITGGMFEVVSTGNDVPLIDLANVSDELNEAAADAELIILEGMGRAVETNFDAEFKVDTLHLALLKDESVARSVGGELYDCVCRYKPAPRA